MGSTPVGGSENSFSEYFDLRTLPHYLHFIEVSNPFIIIIIIVIIIITLTWIPILSEISASDPHPLLRFPVTLPYLCKEGGHE